MKKTLVLLTSLILLAGCDALAKEPQDSGQEATVNVMEEMQTNQDSYENVDFLNLSYLAPSFFTDYSRDGTATKILRGDEGSVMTVYGIQDINVLDEQNRQDIMQGLLASGDGLYGQNSEEKIQVAGRDAYHIKGQLASEGEEYAVDGLIIPNQDSYIAYVTTLQAGEEELTDDIMNQFIDSAKIGELSQEDKDSIEVFKNPMLGVKTQADFTMPAGWQEVNHNDEGIINYLYSKDGSLATIDMWPSNFSLDDEEARDDLIASIGGNFGEMSVDETSQTEIDGQKAYRYDASFNAQGVPGKGAIVITEKDDLMMAFMVIAADGGGMDYDQEITQMMDSVTFTTKE
ncbi:hypothetical protein [Aerococcus kribbianus]|uniref:DUF4825 domain-containing protein n=1 Tax=Aerococcus kribbianus TaxID=2999064 RepID=A0A9X3FUI4_9LACT|nr:MULTISPECIES: hypothetical protein [unclassified Aerococcus]MCZ0717146.1 hypothetical protein [Aerococcus sp. YH-aer221]MCZ0725434.1 hypothetical protein [Aerococcus sp. YH-aer222]